MDEAKWLDSIVRQFIPKWMQWIVEKNAKNVIGRLGHFVVDFIWIGKVQGIKIKRNQDTTILGGKGYRPNVEHGYRIDSVRTTISRRGKEIATQKFSLDIIIKK